LLTNAAWIEYSSEAAYGYLLEEMHYRPIHMGELESGEEFCLRNCVNAFKEIGFWPEEELRRLV
jgi:hypothetical protein